MSEPDAWDPGSPRNRERTQEYQRQARHLLMELDPIGRVRHAGGSRRIRLHDRSTTTSTVPRNRIHHPRLITRFATVPPPEPGRTGDTAPVVIHTVIVGGMPGGKIILIAAAVAALAAVAAVLLDRARATRRHMTAPSAYSAPPLPSAAAAGPGQTCRSPWRSSPPTSRPRMVPPRWPTCSPSTPRCTRPPNR